MESACHLRQSACDTKSDQGQRVLLFLFTVPAQKAKHHQAAGILFDSTLLDLQDMIDSDNDELLATLLKMRHIDLNRTILEAMPVICYAAHYGRVKTFKLLLQQPFVDIDVEDHIWKQRPLFRAVKGEEGDGRHLEIVRLLLNSQQVDVDAKEKYGKTALTVAAQLGIVEGVEILLSAGADTDTRDAEGKRPLDYAAHEFWGNPNQDLRERFGQIVAYLED